MLELDESRNVDFRDYWKVIKLQLDQEFVHWVPRFFSDLPVSEVESIHRILESGKRIRGSLLCLMTDALGGNIAEAIPRAFAIECIQAASLVHDDYVDEDIERRQRPAMWTVQGPRKAVLLGDVILATVIQRMVEMSRADGLIAAHTIAAMAMGAYRECLNADDVARTVADGTYRRELYDVILHLKTGVLFGAAAQLGALAARASAARQASAFNFGARLGEAYQVADDLHDLMCLQPELGSGSGNILALTPAFLYFWPENDLIRLCRDRQEELPRWLDQARPVLRRRMEHKIGVCVDLANKEISDLRPDRYTYTLRAAPSEIVEMIR